ncbi:MAG: hypothetical protein ACRDHX_08935 [Chloroflexota bacterium]
MNGQLLALDTILPSLLVFAGLVFLAVALLPLTIASSSNGAKPSALATSVTGLVGVACVVAGVVLWVQLLGSETATAAPQAAQTAASTPGASATGAASPSATGASASAASTSTPVPAPTATLVPVAPIAFQPDNAGPHDVTVAVESFEHGVMIFRADTTQDYVLLASKTFKVYPDTWDTSQPASGGLTPPPGKVEPRRGFGKLWRADPDVRQGLGWGLSAEAGMTASISGDGKATTIRAASTYTLNADGTWSAK